MALSLQQLTERNAKRKVAAQPVVQAKVEAKTEGPGGFDTPRPWEDAPASLMERVSARMAGVRRGKVGPPGAEDGTSVKLEPGVEYLNGEQTGSKQRAGQPESDARVVGTEGAPQVCAGDQLHNGEQTESKRGANRGHVQPSFPRQENTAQREEGISSGAAFLQTESKRRANGEQTESRKQGANREQTESAAKPGSTDLDILTATKRQSESPQLAQARDSDLLQTESKQRANRERPDDKRGANGEQRGGKEQGANGEQTESTGEKANGEQTESTRTINGERRKGAAGYAASYAHPDRPSLVAADYPSERPERLVLAEQTANTEQAIRATAAESLPPATLAISYLEGETETKRGAAITRKELPPRNPAGPHTTQPSDLDPEDPRSETESKQRARRPLASAQDGNTSPSSIEGRTSPSTSGPDLGQPSGAPLSDMRGDETPRAPIEPTRYSRPPVPPLPLSGNVRSSVATESHGDARSPASPNGKQTAGKQGANREQTESEQGAPVSLTASKQGANGEQTESDRVEQRANRERMGSKQGAEQGAKWEQTESAALSLALLSGLQRALVLYVADLCKHACTPYTPPVRLHDIATCLQTTAATAKDAVKRVTQKGFIAVHASKTGRGGWSQYTMPQNLYREALALASTTHLPFTTPETGSKQGAERGASHPSSSRFIDLTTTSRAPSSGDKQLAEEFAHALAALDFDLLGASDAMQLWRTEKFETPTDVIESIEHMAFYIKSGMAKEVGKPKAFAMRELLKGYYGRPAGFMSADERAEAAKAKAAEEKALRLRELRLRRAEAEFDCWYEELPAAERTNLLNEAGQGGPFINARIAKATLRKVYGVRFGIPEFVPSEE